MDIFWNHTLRNEIKENIKTFDKLMYTSLRNTGRGDCDVIRNGEQDGDQDGHHLGFYSKFQIITTRKLKIYDTKDVKHDLSKLFDEKMRITHILIEKCLKHVSLSMPYFVTIATDLHLCQNFGFTSV